MVQQQITALVGAVLDEMGLSAEGASVEHPADASHGDYSTNVALLVAKQAGKPPRDLAEDIVARIVRPDWLEEVSVAGPGFVNFRLARTFFRDTVRVACAAGARWGTNDAYAGMRVLVEHTQPNPFKPFHIGHLMSNTLGESITRLYRFSGAEVRAVNYQGDVGLHVAKCLWGLKKLGGDPRSVEDLGRAYVEGTRAYDEDGEEAKREIVSYNKMVYEQAHDIAEEYRIGREVSLAHFEDLYRMLGTRFDHYFFESQTAGPGRALVKEGLAKGVFKESDGAVVFPGEEHGLHTRVFLTKEGLPTYEAKELGLAELKSEYTAFDRSITTTAVEQKEYMAVVYKALSLLRADLAGKLVHLPHGMMLLTTGKMSSRKGNVITGEWLLTEMRNLARDKVAARDLPVEEKDAITDAVAVAAIKFSILKQKAGKNITFDAEQALSFEGDSGPYLQYAHTRARSVLAKAKDMGLTPSTKLAPSTVSAVERMLPWFPEVVRRAAEEHEPHHITTYLIELSAAWNTWYAAERIIDDTPVTSYKLAVAEAFAHTLANGLTLLGITPLERM